MTPVQARYLAYIRKYMDQYGIAPAESDIGHAMCVSPPSVNQMVKALEKAGYIARTPGASRSIRILLPRELTPIWKKGGQVEIPEGVKNLPKVDKRSAKPVFVFNARLYAGDFPDDYRERCCERDLELRAEQTLEDLHRAMLSAFDRKIDAEYEFNIGGKKRFAPEGKSYGLPEAMPQRTQFLGKPSPYDGDARTVKLQDAGLVIEQTFGYCFDFKLDWYHILCLTKIDTEIASVNYPRMIRKVGKPPQQVAPSKQRVPTNA